MISTASQEDFEGLARRLRESGVGATAPAVLIGRSGAKHEFAFAVSSSSGRPLLVVDAVLSIKDVEEFKVLSFYAKVFDLAPDHALLCVSPHLGPRGRQMADDYNISVLENEIPRALVPMVADYLKVIMATGPARQ